LEEQQRGDVATQKVKEWPGGSSAESVFQISRKQLQKANAAYVMTYIVLLEVPLDWLVLTLMSLCLGFSVTVIQCGSKLTENPLNQATGGMWIH